MSTRDGFYLVCGLMMAFGVVVTLLGALVIRRFDGVGGFILALGCCCVLMGPFMAAIGPRS